MDSFLHIAHGKKVAATKYFLTLKYQQVGDWSFHLNPLKIVFPSYWHNLIPYNLEVMPLQLHSNKAKPAWTVLVHTSVDHTKDIKWSQRKQSSPLLKLIYVKPSSHRMTFLVQKWIFLKIKATDCPKHNMELQLVACTACTLISILYCEDQNST